MTSTKHIPGAVASIGNDRPAQSPVPELPHPDEYVSVLLESFHWRYGNGYDSWSPSKKGDRGLDAAYSMVLSAANRTDNARVLDIGAGTGERFVQYLPEGCIAVGLDLIAQPMWPELMAAYHGALSFVAENFFAWTAPAQKFDVIIDSGIMHHQHPSLYEPYLRKVRSILAPRGVFGLLVYKEQSDPASGSMQTTDHGRLCANFTEGELRRLLSVSGFAPFETSTVHRNDGVPYLVMCSTLAAQHEV